MGSEYIVYYIIVNIISSAEAEYVAAFSTATSVVSFRNLLEDIGKAQTGSTLIWCDNTAAIAQSRNPIKPRAVRHMKIRYHYLRDLVKSNIVRLEYIETSNQIADILTKPLTPQVFSQLRPFLVQSIQ